MLFIGMMVLCNNRFVMDMINSRLLIVQPAVWSGLVLKQSGIDFGQGFRQVAEALHRCVGFVAGGMIGKGLGDNFYFGDTFVDEIAYLCVYVGSHCCNVVAYRGCVIDAFIGVAYAADVVGKVYYRIERIGRFYVTFVLFR